MTDTLFSFEHRVDNWCSQYNGSLLNWLILIVKTCAMTPLTEWHHWLVQDSRGTRTIWTFKLLQFFFQNGCELVIYVKICVIKTINLRSIHPIEMATFKKAQIFATFYLEFKPWYLIYSEELFVPDIFQF